MNTCESCQAHLLDMLYGLLDEQERREVMAHLSGCASCRAALDASQTHMKVLAEAAKGTFPEVRFHAPGQAAEPARVPSRRRRPIRWGRWAVAASVFVGFVGLIYLGVAGWQERSQALAAAQRKVFETQTALNQFRGKVDSDRRGIESDIQAIQREIDNLVQTWQQEHAEVEKTLRDRNVQVVIRGPRVIQAGARNDFQIDVHGKNRSPLLNLPLTAQVVNSKSKEVLFEKKVTNHARLELPRDLPVKPGVDLMLVVKADLEDGTKAQVSEQLSLLPTQYLTHLTTDRPMYKPGETVRFRSLTLERFSLKPPDEDLQLRYRITGPNDVEVMKTREGLAMVRPDNNKELVRGPDGRVLRGLGAGEFPLPAEIAGGEYVLTVTEAQDRFPEEKRKFVVNRYQPSRINKEVTFSQRSYGPGDKVEVTAKATRADTGNPVAGQGVSVSVFIDNQRWHQNNYQTDPQGNLTFSFNLPDQNTMTQRNMARGEGSVSVQFNDQGLVETQVRPIPIVLKKLFVDFYPEGGDLVAGFPNRVYFQVEDSRNKPADMRGRIVDQTGKVAVQVRTFQDDQEQGLNHGLGICEFVPEAGKRYELKIDSPIGIEGQFPLPVAKAEGVVLNVSPGVVTDQIDGTVRSAGKDRQLVIGAYCRGRLIDQQSVRAKAGEATPVSLRTAAGVSGVYRVTVFETRGNDPAALDPVAERLVYRKPVERLQFDIGSDQTIYAPGERVKLRLESRNEKSAVTPAILLVSVVDLSLLKLADEKTARAMPTHFLLTTEVRRPEDLENADFLLGDHPRASQALDLLLGTQGWRRFAEQDPQKLQDRKTADGQRLLAATGQGVQVANNMTRLAASKVDQKYGPEFVKKQKRLAARESEAEKWNNEAPAMMNNKQMEVNQALQNIQQASQQFTSYQRFAGRLTLSGIVVALVVLGLAGLAIGLVRLANGKPHAVPFFVTGVCMLVFVFMGSLVGTFLLAGSRNDALRAMLGADPEMQAIGMNMPVAKMAVAAQAAPVVVWDQAAAPMAPVPEMDNVLWFELQEAAERVPRGKRMLGDLNMNAMEAKAGDVMGMVGDRMAAAEGPMAGGERFGLQVPGQQARRRGDFGRIAKERLARLVLLPPIEEPFAVREYAHRREGRDDVRRDFTETLYWHPALVLVDGKGEVSFDLNDSATRFQVLAVGHTVDGRLGTGTLEVASRLPFSLEPKVPIEISSSDKVTIPVSVTNNTDQNRSVMIEAQARGLIGLGEQKESLQVGPRQRGRSLFYFRPGDANAPGAAPPAEARLRFLAQFDNAGWDKVEHTFKIVPDGFPVVGAHSGLLEKSVTHDITLPEDILPGTLQCKVEVFPSTLADLQKGLEGLLREPHGCFEQSSSSNYPNVLILNYLEDAKKNQPGSGVSSDVEGRARKLLTSGYGKLTSFECMDPKAAGSRRGYEWFGQTAPPHEALTAYGLLQFRDMAKVHPVDAAMVERTRKYLLDQRDGKGGFKRNPRALDSFGRAPEHITNAYIVWALTETGDDDLGPELTALQDRAKDSQDPYFVALVGISLFNRNKTEDALALLKNLRALQKEDGHLKGTTTSITGSGGRDLQIEATSLAALAWIKANRPDEFQVSLNKAVKWIGQQRGGHGAFGSTQATILALKTLIAERQEGQKKMKPGTLRLYVNEQPNTNQPVAVRDFHPGQQEPIVVGYLQPGLEEAQNFPPPGAALQNGPRLHPGNNKVRIEIGDNALPYTLSWSYRTLKPVNPEGCPVHLTTSLNRGSAGEGETVRLKAIVQNKSGKGQGMAVAIIGLPGGMSLPENLEQLRGMTRLDDNGTKPGLISAFEVQGRELVLYWRDLAPAQEIEVNLDLICRVPGEYKGPASRAYLYYNADLKHWVQPLEMLIETKQ